MNGRTTGASVLVAALLAATAAIGGAGPAAAAASASEGAAAPEPPPVRSDPPPGRRPGATPGLLAPQHCAPQPADAAMGQPAADPALVGRPLAGPLPAGVVRAQPAAERMQLAAVHRLATGRGQVIAVIDTGVYPHERFGSRLRPGGDYLTGGDGLDDCDGHGTAVAGILAASAPGRDTGGVVGIAPEAQLLAIRQSSLVYTVPGPGGSSRTAGDTDTLADAIVLAVRLGATVINISEAVCLPAEEAALAGEPVHAALRYAVQADVVVVAAAGNLGAGSSCAGPDDAPAGQVSLPGWYDAELLTVAAVGPDDAPAPFTVPGPWVDVAAPGTGLRSLAVGGGTTGVGTDGTSFAAPWVAGLAALVREKFDGLDARQVADRITATARRPAGGESAALGHGVVDPIAALSALPEVLTPAPRPDATAAVLPGTTPLAGVPDAVPPVDLLAAGVLLAAAGVVAARPRRHRPDR